jgi:ribosome-binding factor A
MELIMSSSRHSGRRQRSDGGRAATGRALGQERAAGRAAGRARTQRQLRVGEEIRHRLAEILSRQDVRDPDLLNQSITVTEVRISPDMKQALVYARPLGAGPDACSRVLAALNRSAGFLRGRLGRELTLRHTPELHFALDESFDVAEKIDRLLRDSHVAQDLKPGSESTD